LLLGGLSLRLERTNKGLQLVEFFGVCVATDLLQLHTDTIIAFLLCLLLRHHLAARLCTFSSHGTAPGMPEIEKFAVRHACLLGYCLSTIIS
jgi:hypothetical protein